MRLADLIPARPRRALNVFAFKLRSGAATATNKAVPKLLPAAALAYLTGLALVERVRTTWRRLRGRRPRLIWGPSPILNLKYWSQSLRERGYESTSVVSGEATITARGDFDRYRDEFLGDGKWSPLWCDYAMFAWTLRHGDVFMRFFDGGILRHIPLAWWEYPLLRLAGKKLIVSPYGGDIAISGHLGELEEILRVDYPEMPEYTPLFERRILHSRRWANLTIYNHAPGFHPPYDVVWPNQLAIDIDQWSEAKASDADGTSGEVIVVHAPNHRAVKGTAHLERAVGELREDGLRIDLRILEGRPNEEVRAAVLGADIVADQFVIPGYGLFALEGMAAGKPVISNLSALPHDLREHPVLSACPAIDANPSTLREALRSLVVDPALRHRVGAACREYAARYHSYSAIGETWEALVEHVWRRRPLPAELLPPQQQLNP